MNIIEAIQAAETGKLITNNFMEKNKHFLKYTGNGVFQEYELKEGDRPEFKWSVCQFSLAYVLSNQWKVLEKDYFKK